MGAKARFSLTAGPLIVKNYNDLAYRGAVIESVAQIILSIPTGISVIYIYCIHRRSVLKTRL